VNTDTGKAVSEKSGSQNGKRRPINHDIFTDPALQNPEFEKDPLAQYLLNNWRQVLLTICAVAAAWFVVGRFRDTALARRQESSLLFSTARDSYAELMQVQAQLDQAQAALAKPAATPANVDTTKAEIERLTKEKADTTQKLREQLKNLDDARPPYDTLGKLYKGLLAAANNDAAEAKSSLAQFEKWRDFGSVGSEGRFVGELGALAYARWQLDQPEGVSAGRTLLQDLTNEAEIVGAAAAASLAQSSLTPEEKQQALPVVKAFVAKHPEQAELLKDDLARLGRQIVAAPAAAHASAADTQKAAPEPAPVEAAKPEAPKAADKQPESKGTY
jgi:hypothetical protein